jgi:S-adenosylhomocysteine hydrolase
MYLIENKQLRQWLQANNNLPHNYRNRFNIDACELDSLPVLDQFAMFSETAVLKNCCLVAVQHLVDVNMYLIRQIQQLGISPANILITGKPYSTDLRCVWKMREWGYVVHQNSYEMVLNQPLKATLQTAVFDLLTHAFAWASQHSNRKVILLDDGGVAIRMIHELLPFRNHLAQFVAVEQTSRGIFELENIKLGIPVVNVAQSWAKKSIESQFIGQSVVRRILEKLHALNQLISGNQVLILGYGAVGQAVATTLDNAGGYQLSFYDSNMMLSRTIAANIFPASNKKEALASADIIIGCSGRTSIHAIEYSLLKEGAVLFSGSSSDIEFEAWHLRAQFKRHHWLISQDEHGFDQMHHPNGLVHLGDPADPSHYLFPIQLKSGQAVYLVNGGCPVNFNTREGTPKEEIQLTMALLYAAVLQAVQDKQTGLIALNMADQKRIVLLFQKKAGKKRPF